MWIFTKDGAVSIVRNRNSRNSVLVRARSRAHLTTFMPGHQIHVTPDADYPYRIIARKRDALDAVDRAFLKIDYPNFKNAATEPRYHGALVEIWNALWDAYRDIRPLAPRNGGAASSDRYVDPEETDHAGGLSR